MLLKTYMDCDCEIVPCTLWCENIYEIGPQRVCAGASWGENGIDLSSPQVWESRINLNSRKYGETGST